MSLAWKIPLRLHFRSSSETIEKERLMSQRAEIRRAATAIQKADGILIGAGAGMGVDSGLPDFRGDEGFWEAYPPFRERGLSFSDLANPVWFERDPQQAWGFYGHRMNLYRETVPHGGFEILKRWSERPRHGGFVFTSNVDGQFQRAGFADEIIAECHGSIHHLQCSIGCQPEIWSASETCVEIDERSFLAQDPLPKCPACGSIARPNILMFGDGAWLDTRTQRQSRRLAAWLDRADGRRLVALECGAGSAIPTVRYRCQGLSSTLIRINPREADVPRGQISLAMGALEALQAIDKELECSERG